MLFEIVPAHPVQPIPGALRSFEGCVEKRTLCGSASCGFWEVSRDSVCLRGRRSTRAAFAGPSQSLAMALAPALARLPGGSGSQGLAIRRSRMLDFPAPSLPAEEPRHPRGWPRRIRASCSENQYRYQGSEHLGGRGSSCAIFCKRAA